MKIVIFSLKSCASILVAGDDKLSDIILSTSTSQDGIKMSFIIV